MSSTIASTFSEAARDYLIDPETNKPICYYKILGIEQSCKDASIMKKAYYKAAQKWHPDKHRHTGTSEVAEEIFKYIQDAWAVINDPNERAYYDAHRDEVLLGGKSVEPDEFYGTETNINLSAFEKSSCYRAFNDEKDGFYSVYEEMFKELAREEQRAACARIANSSFTKDDESVLRVRSVFYRDESIQLGSLSRDAMTKKVSELEKNGSSIDIEIAKICPTFGNSESSEGSVNKFYDYWKKFTTIKEFTHCDIYSTDESKRTYRKLAERENEKLRKEGRIRFSEKIRKIVEFIRARDPRFQKFEEIAMRKRAEELLKQKQEEEELERQKQERKQQIREETANLYKVLLGKLQNGTITELERLELEKINLRGGPSAADKFADEFTRRRKNSSQDQKKKTEENKIKLTYKDLSADLVKLGLDFDAKTPEDREINKLVCKICKQKCISEGEFRNHLTSKKHKNAAIKTVIASSLSNTNKKEEESDITNTSISTTTKESSISKRNKFINDDDFSEEDEKILNSIPDFSKKNRRNRYNDSDDENDIISHKNKGGKKNSNNKKLNNNEESEENKGKNIVSNNNNNKNNDNNKNNQSEGKFSCLKCKQQFTSKNALFKHLKETGHAAIKK